MSEAELRKLMVERSASLFERGFSVGSAGNISAAVEDGFLITPTNSSLGFLDAARISKVDRNFKHVAGDPPSKEVFLHRAFYETVARTGAVVHLHSTYATALSCLEGVDPDNAVPPLTPYVVMRVGRVKLIP
jgi:ribulose-5-phosphate 4-epimerase/fuculose-1-phosphate aldolase